MPHLLIKVNRLKETAPAWPDITEKIFVGELQLERAGILEKGMTSGKTAITFALKDEHGKYYFAQTSAEIISVLSQAIKGAEEHWKANP